MQQYLDLVKDILEFGVDKGDRTGTGTRSIFAKQIRHDLSKGFPLLTTKKIHIKSVIYELLWFLSGSTNIKFLKDNGVSIWNEWADDKGELGPVYGAQWRAWDDGSGKKIDQVSMAIDLLKNNPNSRRIIINGWNVSKLPDERISPQENVAKGLMALPPCHTLYQFYVARNKLSLQIYQRSCDVFLGLPFNIASGAFFTHMMANECGFDLGEVIISIGDAHLYKNHLTDEIVFEQLRREPKDLPKLELNKRSSIFDYKYEDFNLIGYDPHPRIKAPISV